MGNTTPSYFSNPLLWIIKSSTPYKSVLQNAENKQLCQKHILQVERDAVKGQNLIYQWRNNKNTTRHIVEIKHMEYRQKQNGSDCGFNLCKMTEDVVILEVFTEYVYKMHEANPIRFDKDEQIALFKNIIESVDLISKKLGYFVLNKGMVGYNEKKMGKIWINENFSSNHPQMKKIINNKSDQQIWQKETIVNLVNICQLSKQLRTDNKFSYIIGQIKKRNLYSFNEFKHLPMSNTLSKAINDQSSQSSVKDSLLHSNQERQSLSNKTIPSYLTKGNEHKVNEEDSYQKIIKQTKYEMVPVGYTKKIYQVTEQQRQIIEKYIQNRSTFHYPNHPYQDSSQSINRQQNTLINIQTQTRRNNLINKPQSYIKNYHNEATLKINNNTSKRLGQNHSKLQSKRQMVNDGFQPKGNVVMVESMIIVQNQPQDDNERDQNDANVILEQSFIINGLSKSYKE